MYIGLMSKFENTSGYHYQLAGMMFEVESGLRNVPIISPSHIHHRHNIYIIAQEMGFSIYSRAMGCLCM